MTAGADSVYIDRLRRDRLLAGCSAFEVARLLGRLHPVEFGAGDKLYVKEQPADYFYLIESGTLELLTPSGRSLVLNDLHCGVEAASDTANYVCTVSAATPVQALRLPREALAEAAVNFPVMKTRALMALAGQLGGEQLLPAREPHQAAVKSMPLREMIGWLSICLVPPVVQYLGSSVGLKVEASLFLAILSATVLMWLFKLADEFIPPLCAIAAVLIVGLVPSEIALAGFSSRTLPTLIGVYALAAVISTSGLSYRFMLWMLIRLPDTPFWHQTALLMSGYILSPIMPSGNSRLSLLLPFYRDMFDGLKLPEKSRGATALMAATFSGALLFSPMLLTSKSANFTVFGMLPAQLQEHFQGVFWLVAAVIALVTITGTHFLAIRLCFGRGAASDLSKDRLSTQLALLGPMSRPELAALCGFLFFLVGAATTAWHQISQAWLAAFLLTSLLLLGLIGKKDFQQKIDWPMIFYLLSLDGLSRAISYLELDVGLARSLGHTFDFVGGQMAWFIPVALAVTLVLRLVLPITAGMVVAAVILIPIAEAQLMNPWVVVFLVAMFSDIWFWPYQSSHYLQVAGSGLRRCYDEPGFLRYNHLMNLSRVAAAYLSIPYWDMLGLT